jgi:hypothetical protein
MVDILIQGDDQDIVARNMTAAIREIFGVDPLVSARGSEARPGTRVLVEAALLALGIPPAVHAAQQVSKSWELHERWSRLIGRAETAAKDKKATLLIDTGNGKPIPLHAANREQILEALKAIETHLKS